MNYPDLDYLFKPMLVYSFSNYCGRYELLCCPPNETEDDFRYEVRLAPPEETSEEEEEEVDNVIFGDEDDEEWARYKAEIASGNYVPFEEWHTRALPYLQEMVDQALREKKNLWDLKDSLEKFGDHHYSPIPWPVEPLPPGAIY